MGRQSFVFFLAFMLLFSSSPLICAEAGEELPEWGVYIYMAGDNSLYQEVDNDLNYEHPVLLLGLFYSDYTKVLISEFDECF